VQQVSELNFVIEFDNFIFSFAYFTSFFHFRFRLDTAVKNLAILTIFHHDAATRRFHPSSEQRRRPGAA
jgi:hypothetical protein